MDGGRGDSRARATRLARPGRARGAQQLCDANAAQPQAGGGRNRATRFPEPCDGRVTRGVTRPCPRGIEAWVGCWGGPDPVRALVAVLTTFFPLANTVLAGTMNSLLLLLLTMAWACWQRRRDVAGGVLVGAAAVFKLFPAALLPYLAWRRHWKLLAAAVVTGLAGVGLGLAVTSLDHNIYYFREMLPHLAAGTGYRENQSPAGGRRRA